MTCEKLIEVYEDLTTVEVNYIFDIMYERTKEKTYQTK